MNTKLSVIIPLYNAEKFIEPTVQSIINQSFGFENIELLLIEIPSAESWSNNKSNETKAFADEHDLKFIDLNLNGDEFDFDWREDTKDKGDHLNVYGATKVSKYLGNYIKQNYDIPDRRNDESYRDWYTDSETYHKDIKKMEELIKNK